MVSLLFLLALFVFRFSTIELELRIGKRERRGFLISGFLLIRCGWSFRSCSALRQSGASFLA